MNLMKSGMILLFLFTVIFSFLIPSHKGVITLQLPGLEVGAGEPTTVEIDFLDDSDTLVYTLKGEVFIQQYPMQADNVFKPDKLTGNNPRYIRKIRVKAAESGTVLKLFNNAIASVPTMMLVFKAGFLMNNNQPIEIDILDRDDHKSFGMAEVSWYNRDMAELERVRGLHVGKLECHVERTESVPLQPVFKFGPISSVQNNNLIMPENISSFVQGVSALPSQNTVFMASPNIPPNMVFNVAPPPPNNNNNNNRYPNSPYQM